MHQMQRSLVWSQHPSAQWNLRGGRWSSAEYSTKKNIKKSPTFPVAFVYVLHTAAPDHNISCRLRLCAIHRGVWSQHFLSSLFLSYTPRHLTRRFSVVFAWALHTASPGHKISCRLCLCATHRGARPQDILSSLLVRYTRRRLASRFPVVFVSASAAVSIGGSSHSGKEHGNDSALLYQYVHCSFYSLFLALKHQVKMNAQPVF
jgi:hypothetical protein